MAAFQFPDPAVQTTVTNPITGSTYQWKEPPGKWVVTVKMRDVGDIIWEGDNPPNPIGDYKLWYSTDTLELYFHYCDAAGTCAWVPTSAPITMLESLEADVQLALAKAGVAEAAANANVNTIAILDQALTEVENSLGKVTLEEVLTNGNAADKEIILTNGTNDALRLSPEEARIMVGGIGEDVVPRLELRHQTGIQDTSIVKLELDEDGERFDIECDEKVNNIHFRFEEEDKLILNKEGDAEFSGKVKVQPGTSNNEVATYGQLATISEELQQLAPSFERGSWTWTDNENPGPGQYTTIREADDANLAACTTTWQDCLVDAGDDLVAKTQCQRDYDSCLDQYKAGPNPDFSKTQQIKFNATDSQGTEHTFDTAEVGQLIDIFNDSDADFLSGEITAKSGTTFTITRVSSKGSASGLGRIKIFTIDDNVEITNYVRKTGDTMTGSLNITPSKNDTGLYLRAAEGTETSKHLVRIANSRNNYVFYAEESGTLAGMNGMAPSQPRHLVNKKYVDDAIAAALSEPEPAPAHLAWKFDGSTSTSGPAAGYFKRDSNSIFRFSFKTANGLNLSNGLIDDTRARERDLDMTIWEKSGNSDWKMRAHYHIKRWRWNYRSGGIDHFEMHQASGYGYAPSTGHTYYVTIGGWF